jgi:hypothetical protein
MAQINIIVVRNVVDELVDGLVAIGVLDPVTGDFSQPTVEQDAQIAELAVVLAEKHGIDVPAKLEKIVKALPLLLELVN